MRSRRKRKSTPKRRVQRKTVYQRYGLRLEIDGVTLYDNSRRILQCAQRLHTTWGDGESIKSINSLSAVIKSIVENKTIAYHDYDMLVRAAQLIVKHAEAIKINADLEIFKRTCGGLTANQKVTQECLDELIVALKMFSNQVDLITTSASLLGITLL